MDFIRKLELDKQVIEEELRRFLDHALAPTSLESIHRKNLFLKEYVLADAKRLRPALVIETYNASLAVYDPRIVLASLSIELLHNSTLIHDDIMDEDFYRRGAPGINQRLSDEFQSEDKEDTEGGRLFSKASSKYIVSNAILAGDILQSMSIDALVSSGLDQGNVSKALKLLSHAYHVVINGQYLDLDFERSSSITEGDYLVMIKYKTAYLFKAAMQIGAILAGEKDSRAETLGNFGLNTGIAFQLQDDIMDISRSGSKGHEYGSDIRSAKMTMLAIRTLAQADEQDRNRLTQILGDHDATNSDIDCAVSIMDKYGAIDYCRNLAISKIGIAKRDLVSMRLPSESNEFFLGYADYMTSRLK